MMVRIKHRTDTDTITVNINGQVLIINQVWIKTIARCKPSVFLKENIISKRTKDQRTISNDFLRFVFDQSR